MPFAQNAALISAFLAALAYAPPVRADEVEQSITEALKHYRAKRFDETVGALAEASMRVRDLQAADVQEAFPEPLPGWKMETVNFKIPEFPGVMRYVAQRKYGRDGGGGIGVQIIEGMGAPGSATFERFTAGSESIKVGDRDARLRWDATGKATNALYVPIDGNVTVGIVGWDLPNSTALTSYANAVRYDVVEKYAAGRTR